MTTAQQRNLQELVAEMAKEPEDGEPLLSPIVAELVKQGIHHVFLPDTLKPAAAEAFQLAFEGMGGLPRLLQFADRYPAAFYKLFARMVVPTVAPVLPKPPEAAEQLWPSWLTARRLAYQEAPDDPVGTSAGESEDSV